ncbi:uncharacterized protein LOC111259169 isoform X2 [Varroa jacobsoni]|uniref:Ubiquitin-like protein 7 n=1 Tax=Varroa destructor TaxID=109461 RepID=A0A7M7K3K3_VARDE|nr:uncharacterized protein LOC111250343 isoform X2 [Varroa destructor]XP_022686666.1 uncharacterized protein LOC111259169 isoform X2 [Varroa jacobsoni]
MSQVYIMEMSPGKTEEEMCREKCFTVERGTTVGQLRTLIGDTFGRHLDHFQLIYAGKILNDSISLEAAGVKKDSTVLLYPKIETTRPSPSTGGKVDIQMQVLRSMPHLECSTIALLQSERLLKKWVIDKNQVVLDRIAQEHPYLGDALKKAMLCVMSQGVPAPKQSGNAYSVDALSEDSSDDEMQGYQQQVPRPGGSRSQSSGVRTPDQQTGRLTITDEMLQAALQTTYSENHVASQAFSSQLAIMREMGLTDERACVRALVRTGGDVDMAVDLLLNE